MQDMNEASFAEAMKQPDTKLPEKTEPELITEEAFDADKELKYQRAVSFMQSIRCMTACQDKVRMYKNVAAQFADLSGYKDSELLMRKCGRKAKKVREEIKKSSYERAQFHMNKARSSADYKQAAEEFRKIKGYLDADELALKCDDLSGSIEKKGVQRIFLSWGLLILGVLLLVFCLTTPYTKYFTANLSMKTGSYHFAADLFEKLGSYKDSESKYTESRYQYGGKLEEEGSYEAALKVFAKLGTYKNSADKGVALEKLVLRDSKLGDTVLIGNMKWIVLDISEGRALLLSKKAQAEAAYHSELKAVTWENSALREYLNSQYFTEVFTQAERANISLSTVINNDNSAYGTDGGNDTQDYIFLLSTEEARKYSSLLPVTKTDTWLRSPGYLEQNAALLSGSGEVMDYGYGVSSDQIALLPAMWYRFE
jgi:hypothetical protein